MSLKLSQKKLAGLTIIELLISTAIAVMILSALITTYIAVKSKYSEYKDKTTTEAKELLVKIYSITLSRTLVLHVNLAIHNKHTMIEHLILWIVFFIVLL